MHNVAKPYWLVIDELKLTWVALSHASLDAQLSDAPFGIKISSSAAAPANPDDVVIDPAIEAAEKGPHEIDAFLYEYAVVNEKNFAQSVSGIKQDGDFAKRKVAEYKTAFLTLNPLIADNLCVGILLVQGYSINDHAARTLAYRYNKKIIALENTFQSDRITFSKSSGYAFNKQDIQTRFKQSTVPPLPVLQPFIAQLKNVLNSGRLKSGQHRSGGQTIPADARFILVIGQVYTDSALLFGGSPFQDLVHLLRNVHEFAAEKRLKVLVKLHPKEHSGSTPFNNKLNRLSYRKLMEDKHLAPLVSQEFDDSVSSIVVDSDNVFSTNALIKSASMVVGFNSQALLEAAIFGKRVISVANAFFDCLGIVSAVKSVEELRPAMQEMVDFPVAPAGSDIETSHLVHFFLQQCTIPKTASALVGLMQAESDF